MQCSINDDAISKQSLMADHLYSNGSELYAEIGTQPNSARSSTYAHVGSLSMAQHGTSNASVVPQCFETRAQLVPESDNGTYFYVFSNSVFYSFLMNLVSDIFL